jgi:hypothetical protein
MDDLSGLEWSSHPPSNQTKTTSSRTAASYPTLRPTPSPGLSSRSTPLSGLSSKPASKPSTPANDSFSNLVSFGSTKNVDNLSLQERQRQLQEQKRKEEAERQQKLNNQFQANHSRFWDGLGASNRQQKSTQNTTGSTNGSPNDELLSAFSSAATVDRSGHFPSPASSGSKHFAPNTKPDVPKLFPDQEEDDPFDLKEHHLISSNRKKSLESTEEDDVLGLLAKPVSELPKPQRQQSPSRDTSEQSQTTSDPRDQAAAEIVDMGFPMAKARAALARTESGTDVQAAVGWLLNQAHEESRQKTNGSSLPHSQKSSAEERASVRSSRGRNATRPAWMDEDSTSDGDIKRTQSTSPANSDKDISQIASEVGNNLFKTANSLWTTSRKKVQKAVQELQQDGDPNQPKWMREAQAGAIESRQANRVPVTGQRIHDRESSSTKEQIRRDEESRTEEALRLELGDGRPPPRRQKNRDDTEASRHDDRPRTQSPALSELRAERRQSNSSWMNRVSSSSPDPRSKLSRQAVEEQSSQAYVSPARRKKAASKSTEPMSNNPFEQNRGAWDPTSLSNAFPSSNPFHNAKAPPVSKISTPIPTRPKAPYRAIPPTSSHALQTSSKHRLNGTEAFKRGDYASAHTSYSSALSQLPDLHPVTIVILTNRALTSIKVGEPKAAVSDADKALAIIGVSRGEGEVIDTGPGEAGGKKDMKDFFGKALLRKAEALEAMEKWDEALKVWIQAVEAGVGGSVAIQSRNRCEKASRKAKAPPISRTAPSTRKPPPKTRATLGHHLNRPKAQTAASAEAIARLRAANSAADAADDEKFALSDAVDAKLIAWKGSKEDNLRALLESLDKILWPEAGWKKIGMADLIIPGKVKIHYMKGIAKVHPDKVSSTLEFWPTANTRPASNDGYN